MPLYVAWKPFVVVPNDEQASLIAFSNIALTYITTAKLKTRPWCDSTALFIVRLYDKINLHVWTVNSANFNLHFAHVQFWMQWRIQCNDVITWGYFGQAMMIRIQVISIVLSACGAITLSREIVLRHVKPNANVCMYVCRYYYT